MELRGREGAAVATPSPALPTSSTVRRGTALAGVERRLDAWLLHGSVQPLLDRVRGVLDVARNVDTVLLEAGHELGRRRAGHVRVAAPVRGRARVERGLHRRVTLMIAQPLLHGAGVVARYLHSVRGQARNESGVAVARLIRAAGASGEGACRQYDYRRDRPG